MRKSKLLTNTSYQIADSLKLPKDLSRGESLISITGHEDVYIENYKGILECSDTCVLIATQSCRVQIRGSCLKVEYYTEEEMKISGYIQEIVFL